MEQKCPKCGASISENAKFCPDCGTPITKPSAEVAPKEEIKKPENVVSEAPKGDYDSLIKSDSKFRDLAFINKLCFMIIGAVLIDIILILIAFLIPAFEDSYGTYSFIEVIDTNDILKDVSIMFMFAYLSIIVFIAFIIGLIQLLILTFKKEKFVKLYNRDNGFTLQRKIMRNRLTTIECLPLVFVALFVSVDIIYSYDVSPIVYILLALGCVASYGVIIAYIAISTKIIRKHFPKDQYKRL